MSSSSAEDRIRFLDRMQVLRFHTPKSRSDLLFGRIDPEELGARLGGLEILRESG